LAGVDPRAILGIEASLWTESVANARDAEFLALPRLAAVAEIGWPDARTRNWDDFKRRIAAQEPRWTALGINFYRPPEIPW
jgi:hexosaminidase